MAESSLDYNYKTALNEKKIAQLYLKKAGETVSWRNLLSSMIVGKLENSFIGDKLGGLSDLNVNSKINLFIEEPLKSLSTNNSTDTPFDTLYDSARNLVSGGISKLTGGLISKDGMSNIIDLGTSVVADLTDKNATGHTFSPWLLQAPSFKSTSNPTISYTFHFRLGQYGLWNAKEEVVKPILNLIAPSLPREINNYFIEGNLPTKMKLVEGLIGEAWETISNFFNKNGGDTQTRGFAETLSNIASSAYDGFLYDLVLGPMRYFDLYVINASSYFSEETDDKGWPISGKVQLSLASFKPIALESSDNKDNTGLSSLSMRFGGN